MEPYSTTSKRRSSSDSDGSSRLKKQSREGDTEQSHYSHGRLETEEGGDDDLFFSSQVSSAQRDHHRGHAKGKTKDSPLPATMVDRNVFDDFSMSDLRKSSQHSAKKRLCSVESDVSADDFSVPRPKLVKLHQKPEFTSFGVKENG